MFSAWQNDSEKESVTTMRTGRKGKVSEGLLIGHVMYLLDQTFHVCLPIKRKNILVTVVPVMQP